MYQKVYGIIETLAPSFLMNLRTQEIFYNF